MVELRDVHPKSDSKGIKHAALAENLLIIISAPLMEENLVADIDEI